MKHLIILLSMIFLSPAIAEPVDIAWQAPVEYEDDTPLTTDDLLEYTLTCGGRTFTYPGDQNMTTEDFAPGTYSCVITVTSVEGLISTPSNQVSFTVARPPSPPKAPILSVTIL